MTFLPAHYAEMFVRENIDVPSLRMLMTGGEALHDLDTRRYIILCCYGTSEVGGPATYFYVDGPARSYPIGKPLPLRKMYLLDENLKPVTKAGEIGEICFAGPSLSDGYSSNAEQTAARFIENPFCGELEYRTLYRIGDLAALRADREYVYVCRSDLMCKIRSFRIELGEVEGTILNYPGIERCVVKPMSDGSGEKALHAFYYSPHGIDESALRQYLRDNLLHYKIPGYFHRVSSMPVTDNGKINRAKLVCPGYSE